MPVIIKTPIDVIVKLINTKESKPAKGKSKSGKSRGRGRPKKAPELPFFTDEDLLRKASRQERHVIPPKDLFSFIDALDAYEVEKGLEEELVVDITEITNDGLVVIHIEPKKMIRYADIYDHLEAMITNAFNIAGMKDYTYEIKKILFRIHRPGTPSSVVKDLNELKDKVEDLWESEFGDEMKSYI
ncbi:MAG: hypothetical protein JSV49_00305 [Thermoplasmata archaeon]|nr:MAG: hypothetical protein JSV49_00305 [Thermoplasmata archaeon]